MSKLSLKRKRTPILGPITSRVVCSQNRPTPQNRNEFSQRQLEVAIDSTEIHKKDCYANDEDVTDGSKQANSVERTLITSKSSRASTESKLKKLKNESNLKSETIEETIYCICRKGERPNMIGCDHCDEWYHKECLKLSNKEFQRLTKKDWSCPSCEKDKGNPPTHKVLSSKLEVAENNEQTEAVTSNFIVSSYPEDYPADNSVEAVRKVKLSAEEDSSISQQKNKVVANTNKSLSISRKWTPPAMVAYKSDTADIRKSLHLSPRTPAGHSTTRIRVGLSRNFKSPKPLHSSVKWTA